jgi:hypothetical protein
MPESAGAKANGDVEWETGALLFFTEPLTFSVSVHKMFIRFIFIFIISGRSGLYSGYLKVTGNSMTPLRTFNMRTKKLASFGFYSKELLSTFAL